MMHLNVETEIRNGLELCKYCLNHPGIFKGAAYRDSNGKRRINLIALLPPFSLTMGQVLVALAVELNLLVFLTSQQDLLDVIIKFIAMVAITKFDDMYAATLQSKMKACAGKRLQKKYSRHMSYTYSLWQTK
jgi:hypothetical protein